MSRRQRQLMALALLASDLVVTALVWFAAYALRFACWPAPAGVPGPELVAVALPQVLLLAVVAYRVCGMYQVHRLRRFWAEAGTVAMASGLLFLLTTTVTFYFRELYESRLALGLFLLLNAAALAASRAPVVVLQHVGAARLLPGPGGARGLGPHGSPGAGDADHEPLGRHPDHRLCRSRQPASPLLADHRAARRRFAASPGRDRRAAASDRSPRGGIRLRGPAAGALWRAAAGLCRLVRRARRGAPRGRRARRIGHELPHAGAGRRADRRPARKPALRPGTAWRQAGHRLGAGRRRPGGALAADAPDRALDQADQPRPDLLSPGALRAATASTFQMLKFRSMRIDAEQADRPGVGGARTTPLHAAGPALAPQRAWTSCRSSSTC